MKNRLLFMLVPALLYGCSDEPIRTYKAPKEHSEVPTMQPASRQAPAQPAGKGFDVELPDGWTEKPGSGMRIVSYAIDGTAIDFYLISLTMGDVPSNVNRWREQVGLAPAAPEDIARDVQTFQAGGREVHYVEIYNEAGGKGIIAAIIDLAPQFWYFTAKGSVEELRTNADDIRRFLESVKVNH